MKVAMWYNNKDIRIEEVPTPKPGPEEMLVQVMSCGICGSDVVEWYRLPRGSPERASCSYAARINITIFIKNVEVSVGNLF